MVTYLKTMVAVARLSGQIGKSMEFQNFQNWRLVVPLSSAWGFGQIPEKTWPEFFQASPDVTIQDGGETPILEKDLARIFSSQL
jgi:hypothetical protein